MTRADLAPELIQFIHAMVPSYESAVVLVHVSRDPDRVWDVEGVVAEIGPESIAAPAVRQHLDHFLRAGLLGALPEDRFQFQPRSEELRTVVHNLRVAYDQRPVTLIRVIDSAARAKIQSFADSFKLKRD